MSGDLFDLMGRLALVTGSSKGIGYAIAPGYFRTELNHALVDDAEFSAWLAKRTPAGRWGEPSRTGGRRDLLCSDASSFVNGHTLYVDGGITASL